MSSEVTKLCSWIRDLLVAFKMQGRIMFKIFLWNKTVNDLTDLLMESISTKDTSGVLQVRCRPSGG